MKLTRTPMVCLTYGLLVVAALIGCRPGTTESEDTPTLAFTLEAPTQTLDPLTPTPSPNPPTPVSSLAGLDGTLIAYTSIVSAQPTSDLPLQEHWAFKTRPSLPFLDPTTFDLLYGKAANARDGLGMLFDDYRPRLSPDGRYLLLPGIGSSPDGIVQSTGLWLIDLVDGAARELLPDTQLATWNPAGDAITYVAGDTLYTLSVAEGATPQPLFQHSSLWPLYAHWSPDGRWIVTVTGVQHEPIGPEHTDLTLTYWLVPTNGEPARELTVREDLAMEYATGEMSWSPDGQYLMMRNEVFDLEGNQVSPERSGGIHWLPNDSVLLKNTSEGLRITTIAGEELAHVSDTFADEWVFSHDGRRLAYTTSGEDGSRNLAVYDLERGESQIVGPYSGEPLRWSADDSHLLMSVLRDGRVQIVAVSVESNGEERVIVEDGYLIEAVPYPVQAEPQPPARPTIAPTVTPGPPPPPGPTTPPLPAPLTAEQALETALALDLSANSRIPITPEELAAGATVSLHDGPAAADAALGLQTGYAAEIEADAGQVWLVSLPGPVWGVPAPGWSPWAVYDGIAYQVSARTGHLLGVHAGPRRPGLAVLFARDDDLYRTDAGGEVVEQLTTGGRLGWGMAANDADWWLEAMMQPPRVSPDGYAIAFAPHSTTVVVAGVQRPLLSTPLEFPGTGVLAWSPDSRWLAYAVDENGLERSQLAVYDLYNQTTALLLDEAMPDIRNLAWSPDSSRIAFGCCFVEDFDDDGEYLGTETGELRVVRVGTHRLETAGSLWSSIGGGTQGFCWTQDNQIVGLTAEDAADLSSQCSTLPDGSTTPDGQRRFFVTGPPQPDAAGETVYTLVVEDVTAGELWRRDLEPGLWPRAWSSDGTYILLDDDANHSPIWRIRADGTGELEVLLEDAYLLAVVPAWH